MADKCFHGLEKVERQLFPSCCHTDPPPPPATRCRYPSRAIQIEPDGTLVG